MADAEFKSQTENFRYFCLPESKYAFQVLLLLISYNTLGLLVKFVEVAVVLIRF